MAGYLDTIDPENIKIVESRLEHVARISNLIGDRLARRDYRGAFTLLESTPDYFIRDPTYAFFCIALAEELNSRGEESSHEEKDLIRKLLKCCKDKCEYF